MTHCSTLHAQNLYTYDALNRLTQAASPNGTTIQYSYDANGNRLQHIVSSTVLSVDLVWQSASISPQTVSAGGSVTLTAQEVNGCASAVPGHWVKAWLSTDTVLSAGDVQLDSTAVSGIAPFGSLAITRTLVIPSGTSAGSYYVIAKTDAQNAITETSETNNTVWRPLTIQACPVISLAASTTAPSCGNANGAIALVAAGGTAPYQWSINGGTIWTSTNTFSALAAGSYTIGAKDAAGCIQTQSVTLNGNGGTQTSASFTYTTSGLALNLANTSQNATSYTWDFGDGAIASSSSPAHTYAFSGTYTVCLTASNGCSSSQVCQSVTMQYPSTNAGTVPFVKYYNGVDSGTYTYRSAQVMHYSKVDGHIYIVYETSGSVSQRWLLVKLDVSGTPLWARLLDNGAASITNLALGGIAEVTDGFILAIDNFPGPSGTNRRLIKIDRQGVTKWQRNVQYGGASLSVSNNSLNRINHGALTAHSALVSLNFLNPGYGMPVLSQLDTTGGILSQRYISSASFTSAGSVQVIGSARISSTNYLLLAVSQPSYYHVLLAYDDNYNISFAKQISTSGSGSGPESQRLIVLANGNLGVQTGGRKLVQLTPAGAFVSARQTPIGDGLIGTTTSNDFVFAAHYGERIETYKSSSAASFINGTSFTLKKAYKAGNFHTQIGEIVQDSLLLTQYFRNGSAIGLVLTNALFQTGSCPDSAMNSFSGGTDESALITVAPFTVSFVPCTSNTTTPGSVNATVFDFAERTECGASPSCAVAASFATTSPQVCLGQTLTFTNTSAGATGGLLWQVNGMSLATSASTSYTFVAPGAYTIRLIATGATPACKDTAQQTLVVAPNITLSAMVDSASCGGMNGSIFVNAAGGNPPYQYSSNGGLSFGPSNFFTALPIGTVSLAVQDASGCQSTQSVAVPSSTQTSMTIAGSFVPPTCPAGNNGSVTVSAAAAAGTPTFSISPMGGVTQGASGQFTGLSPSVLYTIMATDSLGCAKSMSFSFLPLPARPYFRTRQSGSYNSAETWEWADDAAFLLNVSAACTPPSHTTSLKVVIRSGHQVVVSSNSSAENMVVEAGGDVQVVAPNTLEIY